MQKVSKQSLAMIALSILLAISIALTMTFAALSDSKQANGTITFSGNVALEMNCTIGSPSGTGTTEDPYVFTYTPAGTLSQSETISAINAELAKVTFGLADGSNDAYIQVKATVTVTDKTDGSITAGNKSTATGFTVSGDTFTTTAAVDTETTYNLSQFVEVTALNFSTLSDGDKIGITLIVKAAQTQADATI